MRASVAFDSLGVSIWNDLLQDANSYYHRVFLYITAAFHTLRSLI